MFQRSKRIILRSTPHWPPSAASEEWIKLGHSPKPQVKGGSP
jgi:hypothetical protein